MCHINFDSLVRINSTQPMRDLPKIIKHINLVCKEYQVWKKTRKRFNVKKYYIIGPLELVHTDLCEPTKTKKIQGGRYFMLLTDDYSRMTWVTFLKEKLEDLDNFKAFKAMVDNEMDMKFKCLRFDRGG